MKNLFVYGTLKRPETRKRIIGRVVETTRDSIKGFRKSEIKIGKDNYPALVPDPDCKRSVQGLVLSVMSSEL